MRKIFSIFLIFVLAASLSACGSAPTPKDIAEKYLAAIKAQDEEGISALSEGSYSEDELMGTGRISITRKVKKRGPRAASECAFT